MRKMPKLIEYS